MYYQTYISDEVSTYSDGFCILHQTRMICRSFDNTQKAFPSLPHSFSYIDSFYEEDNEYFCGMTIDGEFICWSQDEYIEDIELITPAQSIQETPSLPGFDILGFDYSNTINFK